MAGNQINMTLVPYQLSLIVADVVVAHVIDIQMVLLTTLSSSKLTYLYFTTENMYTTYLLRKLRSVYTTEKDSMKKTRGFLATDILRPTVMYH